jgi:hypothetical protein
MRTTPYAMRAALALVGVLALAGCSAGADGPTIDEDGGGTEPIDAASTPPPDSGAPDAAVHPHDASPDADADSGDAATDDAGFDAGPLDTDQDGTPDPLDCAPLDPTLWQELPYAYRDVDGDTFTVTQAGTICSGQTLPQGYASTTSGEDCDDTNANVYRLESLYADADGDGVGEGRRQTVCIGASASPGYSSTGTDCDPSDPMKWQLLAYQYRDVDGDQYTVGMSGQVCARDSLPSGYAVQANGDDCDDTNPDVYDRMTVYPDVDGDGVGAGAAALVCTDGSVPEDLSSLG